MFVCFGFWLRKDSPQATRWYSIKINYFLALICINFSKYHWAYFWILTTPRRFKDEFECTFPLMICKSSEGDKDVISKFQYNMSSVMINICWWVNYKEGLLHQIRHLGRNCWRRYLVKSWEMTRLSPKRDWESRAFQTKGTEQMKVLKHEFPQHSEELQNVLIYWSIKFKMQNLDEWNWIEEARPWEHCIPCHSLDFISRAKRRCERNQILSILDRSSPLQQDRSGRKQLGDKD